MIEEEKSKDLEYRAIVSLAEKADTVTFEHV